MKERKLWTKEEDETLMFFKDEEHMDKWCEIAKRMKQKFGKNSRNEKQCRDRYVNHLRLKSVQTEWKREDEEKIIELHKKMGNKWVAIAEHFNGITEIFIKNQFYSRLRKSIRKLNKNINEFHRKEFKEFKLSLVFKLASVVDGKLNKLNESHPGLIEGYSKFLYVLISFTSESVINFLAETDIEKIFALKLIRLLTSFERIFYLHNKEIKKRSTHNSEKTAERVDGFKDHNAVKEDIKSELDLKVDNIYQTVLKEFKELEEFEKEHLHFTEDVKIEEKQEILRFREFDEQKIIKKSSVSELKENYFGEENISEERELEESDEEILKENFMDEENDTSVIEEESFVIEVLYEENSRSIQFVDDVWANESECEFAGWE